MAAPDVRPDEPDTTLAAWRELLATGVHLHPPEIARQIGVSEAALVASRIGTGATRLLPDIARCLTPIDEWGRVLCAFSTYCGVHMPLGQVTAETGDTARVILRGDHMIAEVNSAAIAEAILFVDTDENHGNTRSIQFFDGQGATVLKVFIFHKTAFAKAAALFNALKHADQSRVSVPAEAATSEGQAVWTGRPSEDTQTALEAALPANAPVRIRAEGPHAHVTWIGALKGPRFGRGMMHLHEQTLRSHLRLNVLTHQRTETGLELGSDSARFLSISPLEDTI